MKKTIKFTFMLIMISVMLFLGINTYKGVKLYEETMDGITIDEVVFELRKSENYVTIENISEEFLNILVAVEDHRFYEHDGFDIISFGRAILRNLQQQKFAAGGSTITQQLAKNMFFSFDKALERKVAEYIVAKQMEDKLSKDDILELYVNIIYFGDNYSGIKDASEGYFKVEPSDLTLAQSLLLAGLPQAPSSYALSTHFDEAVKRSDKVIEILLEKEILEEEEVEQIKEEIKSLE